MKSRTAVAITGPDFCWWCYQKLASVPGKPNMVYFQIVKDQLGHEHRVHDRCVSDAVDESEVKFVPHE